MPLIDAFRLREPAHPPAVWLVPRWWAFSRDNRYRIGVVDNKGSVWSHLNARPVYSTTGVKSTRRVAAKQQEESPKKQDALPQIVGEQPLSLNSAPANTHSCANAVLCAVPQSRDVRPSEAAQALVLTPNNITRHQYYDEQNEDQDRARFTKQAIHRSHLPTHQQLRYLPMRQKRGQTQRRRQRTSDLPRYTGMTDHETGCQIVKLNNPKSILKSKVPAELTFAQPGTTNNQHEQPSSSSTDPVHHEDDTNYVDTIVEHQNSIQEFLAGQRDHHQHPWSKHKYPLTRSAMGRELSMMPITAARHLVEPDVIESRTVPFNPTVLTPTPHTCARLSSFPSYQVPDHHRTDMKGKSQSVVEDSGCPLHEIPLIEPLRIPLKRHPLAYNQAREPPFNAPHQLNIDRHLYQSPTNEQYICLHHARDYTCQHNHDHHHAQYKLTSPHLPGHRILQQDHINIQKIQNQYPENQVCYPGYEHNNLHPHFDMTRRHHIMHEDQYANLHHHRRDLTDRQNHHYCHNNNEFPAMYLPDQPTHRHEIVSHPGLCGQDGCSQPECSGCGYERGRRRSYVRTRRGE